MNRTSYETHRVLATPHTGPSPLARMGGSMAIVGAAGIADAMKRHADDFSAVYFGIRHEHSAVRGKGLEGSGKHW